jgi:hypothetical protein
MSRWGRKVVIPMVIILVTLVSLGANTSLSLFAAWPNTSNLLNLLKSQVHSGHSLYLVEEAVVPEYYFANSTRHDQWISTYGYTYRNKNQRPATGTAAFESGILHSRFQLIALSNGPTKVLDVQLERILKKSNNYRFITKLHYDTSFGTGVWQVWELK